MNRANHNLPLINVMSKTGKTANTLTVALTGDTRSSISQITIYVADSMYTLNTVIYNGGVTYYSLEMLEDTTVLDYFDRRNGQTVDIQLIDQ